MKELELAAEKLAAIIWGPGLTVLLLGAGIYFTVRSGFFPIKKARFVLRATFGRLFREKSGGGFAALCTALGATAGTGNITGVASALAIGGAGSVFWMWFGAFFGMMLKFAEAALSVKFRAQSSCGAMLYSEKAFENRIVPIFWAMCCVFASFCGGGILQTQSAAAICSEVFDISPVLIGVLIAVLTAAVLFCGAQSVAKVSSFLVPFMALFYILGCLAALFVFRERVASAFFSIFKEAFTPISAAGGFFGLFVSETFRIGLARGTFTHEAGMGSASIAHAQSAETDPKIQGCWGIVEVFLDTMVVCTLTALVILSSGFDLNGENVILEVFSQRFGLFGKIFLAAAMFLFALAAVIGWAFYGEKSAAYVFGSRKAAVVYRALLCVFTVFGSFSAPALAWSVSDIFCGLMVFPNLAALLALSKTVLGISKEENTQILNNLISVDAKGK